MYILSDETVARHLFSTHLLPSLPFLSLSLPPYSFAAKRPLKSTIGFQRAPQPGSGRSFRCKQIVGIFGAQDTYLMTADVLFLLNKILKLKQMCFVLNSTWYLNKFYFEVFEHPKLPSVTALLSQIQLWEPSTQWKYEPTCHFNGELEMSIALLCYQLKLADFSSFVITSISR